MKKSAVPEWKKGVRERLKKLRHARGLSQEEFAILVGISPSAMSLLEAGRRDPSWQVLLRSIEVLDSSPPEFFAAELQVTI